MWKIVNILLLLAIVEHLPAFQCRQFLLRPRATADVEFVLLHNNDMHARFEEVNYDLAKCEPQQAKANKCYGGFARVAHVVRKYRTKAKDGGLPVLYLNGGDNYFGTLWYKIHRYNITADFLNKLHPDAMTLGNHEFDDGIANAAELVKRLKFPVVSSNMDTSRAHEFDNVHNFFKSIVLYVKDTKVGIIGYTTPNTTKHIRDDDRMKFNSEIKSFNDEAAKLKKLGVNIIIALGHSGYTKDIEIARFCPDVDVVVGAHSHTLLGKPPVTFGQKSRGEYPTIVRSNSGKYVPVVQVFAYSVYMGKLHLQFTNSGRLLGVNGEIIVLDHSVPQDGDILQLLDVYRPNVTAVENEIAACPQIDKKNTDFCKCMQSTSQRVLKDCHLLL